MPFGINKVLKGPHVNILFEDLHYFNFILTYLIMHISSSMKLPLSNPHAR